MTTSHPYNTVPPTLAYIRIQPEEVAGRVHDERSARRDALQARLAESRAEPVVMPTASCRRVQRGLRESIEQHTKSHRAKAARPTDPTGR